MQDLHAKPVQTDSLVSDGLLASALREVPFGIVILDRDLCYVYVNAVAAQLNGSAAESHIGRPARDVVPEVFPIVEPLYRRVFATGAPIESVTFEGKTPAHPGELRWWSTSYFPVWQEGEVKAVVAIFNDVTETKRSEEERRAIEERFASFMANLPGAAWLKDLEGRYVYANPEAQRIFRTGLNDVLGKTDGDLFPEETAKQHVENDRVAKSAEKVLRTVEVLEHEDGDHSSIVVKFPVIDARGEPQFVGGMATDITDRIRIEVALEEKSRHLEQTMYQLEAANRAKDDFLGMVSHELRTPITSILGHASILLRRGNELDDERRRESLSDVFGEAQRLSQIVENLLVLARLEGGQEVDSEPFRMSKCIGRVIEEMQKHYPRRSIRFESSSQEPIALGVESYVDQVLRNYLSNAAKYSDPTEPILVTLRHSQGEIRVRVLDQGIGLANEDPERLFQPFYRSANAENTTGIGVGLTVCRRLIDAQQGRVWGKARRRRGAEFGFAIPVLRDLPLI